MPKTILILGDSWGVPADPKDAGKYPGQADNVHISRLLANDGHDVINASANGGSNMEAMERGLELVGDGSVSWILWLFTNPIRDHYRWDRSTLIQDRNQHLENVALKEFRRLRNKFECRSMAIGGQCALSDNAQKYLQSINTDVIIPDWRNDCLGTPKAPYTPYVGMHEFFKDCDDPHSWRMKELKLVDRNLSLMSRSKMFADNAHPGAEAHKALHKKIKKHFR